MLIGRIKNGKILSIFFCSGRCSESELSYATSEKFIERSKGPGKKGIRNDFLEILNSKKLSNKPLT